MATSAEPMITQLQAFINPPPEDWRHPNGRHSQSWLRTIEGDIKTQNIGLFSAWRITHRCSCWHPVEKTASLYTGRSALPNDDDHDDDDWQLHLSEI